jgi:hypothetical protein
MIDKIPYKGGPRHGAYLVRTPHHRQWPPRSVACIDDISTGNRIGLYRLQSDTLVWQHTEPPKIKGA